ncbi:hypothetical protein DFP72DRAFT_848084 [Ephemerocybe angulata]|uniref:Uncharacterized protein n=1 Tax=Ephemerocybe angulata TaxID=980116 RepID=A0A8H6HZI6_9AGAR|nr:hypothetical protein DFP72DRAFT_848084 [Tulosesus angulatus]
MMLTNKSAIAAVVYPFSMLQYGLRRRDIVHLVTLIGGGGSAASEGVPQRCIGRRKGASTESGERKGRSFKACREASEGVEEEPARLELGGLVLLCFRFTELEKRFEKNLEVWLLIDLSRWAPEVGCRSDKLQRNMGQPRDMWEVYMYAELTLNARSVRCQGRVSADDLGLELHVAYSGDALEEWPVLAGELTAWHSKFHCESTRVKCLGISTRMNGHESTFPSTSRPYHQNPGAPEDDITPLPVSDENESALILSQNSFAEPVASGSRLPNESIALNIMENAASPVASGSRLPNEPIAGHIAEPTENANESGTNPILTQNITADPEDATAFRLSVRKGKRPQIASRRCKQDEQRVSGFPSALASAEEWARTTAAAQHSTEPSFLSNAQLEALGLPGVNLMDLLAPQPGNEVAEGPSHGLSAEFELNGTGSLPQHVTEEYGQSGPLHVAGESAFHNRVGGRQI